MSQLTFLCLHSFIFIVGTKALNDEPMENAKFYHQYHNEKFKGVRDDPICKLPYERKFHRINFYREPLKPYEIPCISCEKGGKPMYFMVDTSPLNNTDESKLESGIDGLKLESGIDGLKLELGIDGLKLELGLDGSKWELANDFFENLRDKFNLKYTPAEQIGIKKTETAENMQITETTLHILAGVSGIGNNQEQLIYELNRPRNFICTRQVKTLW